MYKLLLFISLLTLNYTILASGDPAISNPIQIEKSTIVWQGSKVIGQHEGQVALESGELVFKDGILTGGSFTISMNTISCTDLKGITAKKLVGHLMAADFFQVEDFPTANLIITKAVKREGSNYILTGDLTIKGITKSITFDAVVDANAATAEISVDRTLYGIKYGSGSFFKGLGDKAIKNEFQLTVNLAY